MVTAHPHPRAPQQRGLALRAACKGEWGGDISQARGHTSAALVAMATGGVAKCAVSKQQRVLFPYPLTLLIYSRQDSERDSGVSQVLSSSNSSLFRKKRQPKVPQRT